MNRKPIGPCGGRAFLPSDRAAAEFE